MAEQKVNLPSNAFEQGLVQVYTGNGKGKTTAALGLAVRASGQGLRVHIGQFFKGVEYGELTALAHIPNITIKQYGKPKWVYPKLITDQDRSLAAQGLCESEQAMRSGNYDLLIMDEINVAMAFGLLQVEQVIELIRTKPANVELVLTGRSAPTEIVKLADLVTEMVEIKHPYERGIGSRRGIEF